MSLLNAQAISSLAVPLLRRSLVLGATVLRNGAGDFDGPNGATINVRVRIPRAHKEQVTPGESIDFSDLQEISIPVAVRHLYDAAHLTDEDLTLTLENFGQQVLAPMVA